ncbi:hypothetical protein vBPFY1MI_95 [Pseudomonas phage vB_PF_Y1-MI]|nr:hypothetical protein vBPFY1MI_95 [Pseudomonas phage vB_PF_Y1-MI]
MALFTHGTTLEGLKAIMAGAGKSDLVAPWTVSDNDNQMYFYSVDKAIEGNTQDPGDDPHVIGDNLAQCQQQSMENARLQLAAQGKGGKVYIISCEIDPAMLEDDYSCDGMGDSASCMSCSDFEVSSIIQVQECEVSIWHLPYVLACVKGNSMFSWESVDPQLRSLAESITDGFDCLYDRELKTVELSDII